MQTVGVNRQVKDWLGALVGNRAELLPGAVVTGAREVPALDRPPL